MRVLLQPTFRWCEASSGSKSCGLRWFRMHSPFLSNCPSSSLLTFYNGRASAVWPNSRMTPKSTLAPQYPSCFVSSCGLQCCSFSVALLCCRESVQPMKRGKKRLTWKKDYKRRSRTSGVTFLYGKRDRAFLMCSKLWIYILTAFRLSIWMHVSVDLSKWSLVSSQLWLDTFSKWGLRSLTFFLPCRLFLVYPATVLISLQVKIPQSFLVYCIFY